VEYTDQQRAAFKDVYARRFRGHLIMLGLFFAAMVPLAFADKRGTFFGVSENVLGPIAVVVLVGAMAFSVFNWRCPACRMGLGKGFNPTHCRTCGIELREKREARGAKGGYR
jgi:hypothetical protein